MAAFSQDFLQTLRERSDFIAIVEQQTTLKPQGSRFVGCCPFHNEKTPSFHVNPDEGYFKCFGCGVGGDVITFVMKSQGFGFYEAVTTLAEQAGMPLPDRDENPLAKAARNEKKRLLELLDRVSRYFQHHLHAPPHRRALEYLLRRDLTPETIQKYALGYAPPGWRNLIQTFGNGQAAEQLLESAGLIVRKEGQNPYDRFRDRIIFPIHNHLGKCIAFGGRVLDDTLPKYINSPETDVFHKSTVLFGLHHARATIAREGMILIVEGYMDVIALDNRGISFAVAPLGTALTAQHLQQLWRYTQQIIFCFDGDKAGRKAAWKALEQVFDGLQAKQQARFLFLPDNQDPDEIIRQEGEHAFRQRLKKSTALLDFLLEHLGDSLDLQSPEGQVTLLHQAMPYIEKIQDALLKTLFLQEVKKRLQLPEESLLPPIVEPHTYNDQPAGPYSGQYSGQSPGHFDPLYAQTIARQDHNAHRPSQAYHHQSHKTRQYKTGRGSRRRYRKRFDSAPPPVLLSTRQLAEQRLIQTLLCYPELFFDFEEELAQLHLKENSLRHLLGMMFSHTNALETILKEPDLFLQYCATREQYRLACQLMVEGVQNQDPRETLKGCIVQCQAPNVERETRDIKNNIFCTTQQEGNTSDQEIQAWRAYKENWRERQRLRKLQISSET
ncbi:DNA primase [Magnetococcales bacterium HHB-1]